MVEATGLEPAASWSQTKHSTKLSYASDFIFELSLTAFILYHAFRQMSIAFFMICTLAQKQIYKIYIYAQKCEKSAKSNHNSVRNLFDNTPNV